MELRRDPRDSENHRKASRSVALFGGCLVRECFKTLIEKVIVSCFGKYVHR